MNKNTSAKRLGSRLWIKETAETSEKISHYLAKSSQDEEISQSLFYLGRALYRYSFLQQKEDNDES